ALRRRPHLLCPYPTLFRSDVVIYASDIPAANIHGAWPLIADPSAAAGHALATADAGWASTAVPLVSPTHYVDVTFDAAAGTPYRLWLRMKALNNSKFNDSVWVQFSDALADDRPIYAMNSAAALDVNLA